MGALLGLELGAGRPNGKQGNAQRVLNSVWLYTSLLPLTTKGGYFSKIQKSAMRFKGVLFKNLIRL